MGSSGVEAKGLRLKSGATHPPVVHGIQFKKSGVAILPRSRVRERTGTPLAASMDIRTPRALTPATWAISP